MKNFVDPTPLFFPNELNHTMKSYLFIGDLHIKSDNHDEIDTLLRELLSILADHTFDAIVLSGDVMHYHERLFTQPLNQALHFIETLAAVTMVYVLVGNHDYINNSQFLTRNHWMNALKTWNNVVVVDRPLDDGDVMFVPYVPPGRLIEAMDTVNKKWNYKEVIFCHQEFRGCKMGAVTSVDGDEWDDEFPLVVSGHIHDHQQVGAKILYPGSPLQHAFGDSTIRRLCHVRVEPKNTTYHWIDLHVPRKHIIHCDVSKVSSVLNEVDQKNGDKVKVKLETTPEEFALFKKSAEYKRLTERGVRIQMKVRPAEEMVVDEMDGKEESLHFVEVLERLVRNDEPIVQQVFTEMLRK